LHQENSEVERSY